MGETWDLLAMETWVRRKFLSTANLILSIPSSLRNLMVFPQPNNGNVCRETWDLLAMETWVIWVRKKFLLEVNLILSTPSLPRNLAASLQLNNGNVCKEWDHKDKWKINKI